MQSKGFNHTSEGWLPAPRGLLRCLRCLKPASSEGGLFWRLALRLKLKEGRWALRCSGHSSIHLSQVSPSAYTKAKKPLKRCDLWTCKTREVNQYVMKSSGRKEHMEGRHAGVAACLVDGNYWQARTESTRPSGKDLRSDERWWMGGTLGRELIYLCFLSGNHFESVTPKSSPRKTGFVPRMTSTLHPVFYKQTVGILIYFKMKNGFSKILTITLKFWIKTK